MANYELTEDINPRKLVSAYVNAPFDEGKKLLESKGYRIISLEENARLRIQEGHKSFVSQNGNWVLEDVIYVPNRRVFLTRKSPIMDNVEIAVKEQRNGRDFYLNPDEIEKYLGGAVKLDSKPILTNRFGEYEITRFAFGEIAEDYGNFLKEYGIKEMPIWLANMQDKSFARKLWFRRLDVSRSGLVCCDRDLFGEDRVRGVSEISAEGAKKNLGKEIEVRGYTHDQISTALSNLNLSGLENLILESLRNQ